MAKEIERKFLVNLEKCRPLLKNGTDCRQGYMSDGENCTVRVRVMGDAGYLTVKGRSVGIARDEFEYRIPVEDAEFMLDNFCGGRIVEKVRYSLEIDDVDWVIDEFYGENSGLIMAEAELKSAGQEITIPDWVTAEVTGDLRYYNSRLAIKPYCKWSNRA